MKRILLLNVFLLFCMLSITKAQERSVSGKVIDGDDNTPLPGVNVVIKGTTTGTVTDIDGNYKLNVPEDGSTVVFSSVGYTTQEVEIGTQSVIDVTLASDMQQLSEVVVTALGIEREERALGYSVQEVDGDELNETRQTNVVNSLSGKIAGVQVGTGSGMGGSSRILIRGANSLLGENQPLFVVDGVPIDNSNFTSSNQERGAGGYDYGNAAQDINPDDVESMTVLKGPSAAALYGSRASNGVIIITTKKGSKKKGLGVSINSGVTFDNILILPDYQDKYAGGGGNDFPFQEINGEKIYDLDEKGVNYLAYAVDESWGPRMNGQAARHWDSFDSWDVANFGKARALSPNPDNIKNFFKTGTTFTNNIAVDGGNDEVTFRVSYTNKRINGVYPNSWLTRNTVSINTTAKLTDKFTATVGANYVGNKALGRPGSGYDGNNVMQQFNQWGQRQWNAERMRNYKNPDGSQRTWNRKSVADGSPKYSDNPYWVLYENFQNDSKERLFGNVALSYEIMEGLSITGRAMNDIYTDRREERIAVGSQAISQYKEGVRQVRESNYDLIVNYSTNFAEVFSLTAFVGGNMRYSSYDRAVGTTNGGLNVPGYYNLLNAKVGVIADDFRREKRVNSVFGSVSLGYNSMVYLDLTIRNDWSSTLPKENLSYLYPSATVSFVVSELGPFATSSVLSFWKVRFGWAQVGNDTDPYSLVNGYAPKDNYGSDPRYTVPNRLKNPELKPETTNSWEVGTDIRFLQNRIGLDFTYYESATVDQIFRVAVSPSSGYTSMWVNAGLMTNKGMEAMLNVVPVKLNNGFEWSIGLNWAMNRNKVEELIDGVENVTLNNAPFAVSANAHEGEAYGTILGKDYLYNDKGNRIVGANGTYLKTDDVVPIGNVMADWTGGISNRFSFKGISLYGLIDTQWGGQMFSTTNMWGKYSGMFEETVDGSLLEDVTINGNSSDIRQCGECIVVDGDDENGNPNTVAIDANTHFFSNGGYVIAAADIYDATFIKLRELKLSYTLPTKVLANIPVRDVVIALYGQNLAILYSKVPHLDPGYSTNAGNVQGIEGGQVPSLRHMGFNLSFKF